MNNPPPSPKVSHQQIQVHHRQFSGPLPAPEILEKYNQISPGAADRIIAMAEDNNRHFQTMDKMYMTASYQERQRGQWFGLTIGLAGFATSAFALYCGYPQAAGWLGGSTLVGLVSIFVVGRIHKK